MFWLKMKKFKHKERNIKFKKTYIALLLCVALISQGSTGTLASNTMLDNKELLSLEDDLKVDNSEISDAYGAYLLKYNDIPFANEEIIISAKDYSDTNQKVELYENYEGIKGVGLLTQNSGYVEWNFAVKESSMYQINVKYFGYGGEGALIERALYIDDEIPYKEAKHLNFSRLWKDVVEDDGKDLDGNDIKPHQEEVKRWQEIALKDMSGYYEEPLMFYLEAGVHTLKLESIREPLMIENITLYHEESSKSYAEVKEEYAAKNYGEATGEVSYIQGEGMYEKSEKSNFPVNDRSSSYTQPQEIYSILLNSMGGTKWQNAGSLVTWKLSVPESGLYRIAMRCRQNVLSGAFVTRKLTIDGKLPFIEANNIKFNYSTDWVSKTLGNDEEEYLFYFESGKEYTLGMEVVLGNTADVLRQVEETVVSLNEIYRSILMITGATPDKYRDYSFEKIIPETLDNMLIQADKLSKVISELETISGEKGERIAQLTKMEYQLRRMAEEPSEIAGKFNNFKDNIAALGTWVIETAKQPLELDYFALVPKGQSIPKVEGGFFEKLWYTIQTFFASFVIDYSKMGITEDSIGEKEVITVWLGTGRDQQNTIRNLINSDFTRKTGITVNLQLVNPGTLLPSILAGRGPDVALSNSMGEPINFALRNAVMDLSSFENFNEVTTRFHESAMVPYQYNGATYALPETQSFNMLFYRSDIFEELNIKVPKTWADFDNMIGELQKKNMSIGLPHDLNTLLTFMYQQGAPLYNGNGERSNLDSRVAMLSFNKLVEYYTLYKLQTEYDFVNRFRSGEMPIAIADYTVYNQLSLFAPEIKGNWEMTLVPGTLQKDGSINYSIPSTGTSVMMMKDTKYPDASWKFMDWWTSKEVQASFGIEMESVINASAKQPTANMEALKMLPWSTKDLNNILLQWENVMGTPEVPGGYFTGRITNFAFNKAYNDKEDPSDVLQSYIESLNAELIRKRLEFSKKD